MNEHGLSLDDSPKKNMMISIATLPEGRWLGGNFAGFKHDLLTGWLTTENPIYY